MTRSYDFARRRHGRDRTRRDPCSTAVTRAPSRPGDGAVHRALRLSRGRVRPTATTTCSKLPGYSQAEHHTRQGFAFVACDHLGVGDSDHPDTFSLTYENLAQANHATAQAVIAGLRDGQPDRRRRADRGEQLSSGMGQSMGGCLLTVQQANHRTFDGVAFLGWSGISTNFPAPDGGRISYPMPPRGTDLRPIAEQVLGVVAPDDSHYRFCFHWPDEEPELMEADLSSYRPYTDVVRGDEATPWGSATVPACAVTMMTPGAVAPRGGRHRRARPRRQRRARRRSRPLDGVRRRTAAVARSTSSSFRGWPTCTTSPAPAPALGRDRPLRERRSAAQRHRRPEHLTGRTIVD